MNPDADGKIGMLAETLLRKTGFPIEGIRCTRLAGGRNNRVYCVDTSAGLFLLKQYYQGGDWDRLAAESRFLRFCEQAGIGQVPRLLAEDAVHGAALHSWIEGRRLDAAFPSEDDVAGVAAFLSDLARASRWMRMDGGHEALLPARDACLCLEDFFRSPRERVVDLEKALLAKPEMPMTREALVFVQQTLIPEWKRAEAAVGKVFSGSDLTKPFPAERLIVSPSDFGFHNALRHGDGLSFVDFEYAGLDDPAKAIGDFVCQADFSPPQRTLERLAAAVYEDVGQAEALAARVRSLLPLFRVKFCCIVLNEFKNSDAVRREFASGGQAGDALKKQLLKAAVALNTKEKI